MTGETPGVEHVTVSRQMAMEAMTEIFWDANFQACLTDTGMHELLKKLVNVYDETGNTAGPIILLINYEDESPYLMFMYDYEITDDSLIAKANFEFESLDNIPVVMLSSEDILWPVGYTQALGLRFPLNDTGLPVYN